jgi:hypothetical protein
VLARAAELLCAHYLPVTRAARLMRSMAGMPVSVGFMASVHGRAARILSRVAALAPSRELVVWVELAALDVVAVPGVLPAPLAGDVNVTDEATVDGAGLLSLRHRSASS